MHFGVYVGWRGPEVMQHGIYRIDDDVSPWHGQQSLYGGCVSIDDCREVALFGAMLAPTAGVARVM